MTRPGYWLVVPAAGAGRRFGSEIPKQYLEINGRCVLDHALQAFAGWDRLEGVVVAIDSDDRWFADVDGQLPLPVKTAAGGADRMHSVINGLNALQGTAGERDWVMVHDAVRPCLLREDIDRLADATAADKVGGLLANRVTDTLKQAGAGDAKQRIAATKDRAGLWQALTPQVFQYGRLKQALEAAANDADIVSDESAAIELAGYRPLLVEGRRDNIKLTRAGDLALVKAILSGQGRI